MKEIRDIIRLFETRRDQPMALATLVRARGSSYRRPGARMLICEDRCAAGSLSGGCLEEEVKDRAVLVMRDAKPELVSFDTRRRFGCNGGIDVVIEPVRRDFLEDLAANFRARRLCRVATVFGGGANERGTRMVGQDFQSGTGAFIQEIEPAIRLLIFGDGPDSTALRGFAEILGWEVIDLDEPAELRGLADSRTAAVVKSHNYGRDFAALCALLPLDLPYVGLLGPRQRREQLLNAVLDEGITIDAEIFGPAGLDLGAETPEELALSLVAEIQATFAGASGESLHNRKAPIHGWNVARKPAPSSSSTWHVSAP
ncbi:MAG TPA: XdhC family protein [Chthoniobacterales bacterium]|nr:XdhC family protein [Chthoniobacterales bacterium]